MRIAPAQDAHIEGARCPSSGIVMRMIKARHAHGKRLMVLILLQSDPRRKYVHRAATHKHLEVTRFKDLHTFIRIK